MNGDNQMRQYKFRAWDGTRMDYDYRDACLWNGLLVAEGDTILMQWTGMLDKNGKEIYEGDIVHVHGEEAVCQVIWGYFEDCCVHGETWMLEPQIWEPTLYYHSRYKEKNNEVEVIGNIYETPELLTEQA